MAVTERNGREDYIYAYLKQKQELHECFKWAALAVQKTQEDKNNEIIGVTMVKKENGGMFAELCAQFAVDSEVYRPVIHLITNVKGYAQAYDIDIHSINPESASYLEIFAYASYADDRGIGSDTIFGTFNTFKYYARKAVDEGLFEPADTIEEYWNIRLDWLNMVRTVREMYLEEEAEKQYQEGTKLMWLLRQLQER